MGTGTPYGLSRTPEDFLSNVSEMEQDGGNLSPSTLSSFLQVSKKKIFGKNVVCLLGHICLDTKQCVLTVFVNWVCITLVHGSTCMYDSLTGEGICQYCWKLHIKIPFSLCYMYVNVTLYYNKNYTCSDLFNLQKLKTSFFMRVKINVKWGKKMVYIVKFLWSLQLM